MFVRGDSNEVGDLDEGGSDFRDLTHREIAVFTNGLRHGNVVHVGDLGMRTEKQMMLTPNFGRKSRDQDAAGRDTDASGNESPGLAPPDNMDEMARRYIDAH